jgi:hypothetical protein
MKIPQKISIPDPCSESWDAMLVKDSGRFCNSCQKTVIDFTKMSDEDFVAYFRNNKEMPCGRVTRQQLLLDIPFRKKPLLPFLKIGKYVAVSMIAVASFEGKASGEKITIIQKSNQLDAEKVIDREIPESETITIRGKVLDERGEGAIAVTVIIQNTNYNTITDVDGNFDLSFLKQNTNINYYIVEFTSIGYFPKTELIYKITNPTIIVVLKTDKTNLTGFLTRIKTTRWHRLKWWFKNNFT